MPALMQKLGALSILAIRHPSESAVRMYNFLNVRWDSLRHRGAQYQVSEWAEISRTIDSPPFEDINRALSEPTLADIEREVNANLSRADAVQPFSVMHNADFRLARLCYAFCRALQPEVLIETGVGYGLTTAFILSALDRNKRGTLYSIDLPPLGSSSPQAVGILVPERLRSRWSLRRGPSSQLLPQVLRESGQVDYFLHDSLHTYSNMMREFRTVGPHLSDRAVLIADDIEGNRAFADWIEQSKPGNHAVLRQSTKPGLFGFCFYFRNPSGD